MKVRHIIGKRSGTVADVPDAAARRLISRGLAEDAKANPSAEVSEAPATTDPEPAAEPEPEPESKPAKKSAAKKAPAKKAKSKS